MGTASTDSMCDLTTVLAELRSLHSEFSGFGTKLDSTDNLMGEMSKSIAALEKNMTEVKQNVATNVTRLEEAENRIMSVELFSSPKEAGDFLRRHAGQD